ncbi:formyltransferase family protein [uncultured Pseudodesulfovibrio sp.]|uniref:phosphoribosylglycinamide formyltransferase n=1 Tax=uncultured Pseudodesulfovibrio sp. TaxID=2035858 RepID=UPI0029C64DA8|nr:formyltransferase family protein [uncultured Pseudodesulfovibrio sp.]
MPVKIVVVTASKGTLLGHCLNTKVFRRNVHSVVTDRACGAEGVAVEHGVEVVRIEESDNANFSLQLLRYLKANDIDYVVSIFPRLFVDDLVREYAERIFNIHPALLPAFPGLGSFDTAIEYGVRFVGETIHVVDEGTDTGQIVMQCVYPVNAHDVLSTRHSLFVAECKMLIQLAAWLEETRISVCGRNVEIRGGTFDDPHFSPSLDNDEALDLDIMMPNK